MTDEQLIARYYGCDNSAFAQLYQRYYSQVFAFMLAQVRDCHTAEDLAEEVFVRVVQGKHNGTARFDPHRRTPFGAWLFIIAVNVRRDHFRRTGRRREVSGTMSDTGPEASVFDSVPDTRLSPEELALLRDWLRRMPDFLREALVLVDMEGHTTKEAAAILGIRQGTVASRVYRARRWQADDPGS
jgi:RNA polymerase sigma-70 factor (ECF subfamily)